MMGDFQELGGYVSLIEGISDAQSTIVCHLAWSENKKDFRLRIQCAMYMLVSVIVSARLDLSA